MDRPGDNSFYLFWAAIVMFGAMLANIDRDWTGRPVLGLLLVGGVVGGLVATQVSPFNFADGGFYMEGVILSAASALALGAMRWPSCGIWPGGSSRVAEARGANCRSADGVSWGDCATPAAPLA